MGGRAPSHLFLNGVILIERQSSEVSPRALSLFAGRVRRAIGLRGEVNVLITSNGQLRKLNCSFRKKNKPTDVLSFPSDMPGVVGDIAISGDIALANARRLGHPVTTELKILILHGMLHLAGYDHESDSGEMSVRESKLRAQFDLPVGLIERTHGAGNLRRVGGTGKRRSTPRPGPMRRGAA